MSKHYFLKLLIAFGLSISCSISLAQYKSIRIGNDNKFYFKNSSVHFATYDEVIVSDTIIGGYIIKDIRGQFIAVVSYKVGKEIADSTNQNAAIVAYTEVYFSKNITAFQVPGIACKNNLKQFFESLLYDESSENLPKGFTYNYEIDYSKVDKFCETRPVIYTDNIELNYNPVNDYYRLIKYTADNNTCNKKPNRFSPASTIKQEPKKYIPKKG